MPDNPLEPVAQIQVADPPLIVDCLEKHVVVDLFVVYGEIGTAAPQRGGAFTIPPSRHGSLQTPPSHGGPRGTSRRTSDAAMLASITSAPDDDCPSLPALLARHDARARALATSACLIAARR
jgi:hypothetical protein